MRLTNGRTLAIAGAIAAVVAAGRAMGVATMATQGAPSFEVRQLAFVGIAAVLLVALRIASGAARTERTGG